jgi:F-type H+-transporting ATPase subunit a
VTETQKKSTPINRWIIVLLIVAVVILTGLIPPARPVVLLPGEPITDVLITLPLIGEFRLTNTILTTFIIDIILILMALAISRGLGDEKRPSKGLAAAFEAIIGGLHDTVESTAGKKWAGFIFPLMATIILMVLVSNLIKLVPGMETIGWMHHSTHGHGYEKIAIIPDSLYYIVGIEAHEGEGYEVIPFFRSPSTDINFTASLAIIAVIMVQVIGVKANGLGYFTKYLNFGRFIKIWTKKTLGPFDVINPFIDIFVGILETISEFAKIISFSFRLLGSMFGGAILMIVLSGLLPAVGAGVYFLELFFGVIQALVFGMLTLVFMAVATQSHGSHEGEHAAEH